MKAGSWRGRLAWTLCGLALLLLLAACAKDKASSHIHHAPNGDLREVTASVQELPGFLNNRPQKMLLAYQAAAKLQNTLRWIPCYCGCGESAGHQSNLECFIHGVRDDGSVEWDDHGTRCDVCLNIALQSAQLISEGKSNLEIRQMIDAAYRQGYAAPTKTPMPQA